jgi:hypothetical protein
MSALFFKKLDLSQTASKSRLHFHEKAKFLRQLSHLRANLNKPFRF